ncbi:DegT/DnrJ/EryC1/StrS family aminotransferase [Oleiharenicola sp. Vm1]|uniref:DegT/DnrJ/EryC1/StrS family aminotransferase n=1 Tax=Oleiharenicola sp. Vm1 TaxID=3398393 RepID=UPI0039F4CFE6
MTSVALPEITVTKPALPPLQDYVAYLEQIWASSYVTNNGPLLRQLEGQLRERLQSPHVWFVSNGTIALQIALHAANVDGDVLTTPFSFVATSGALLWERCKPVFVDIEPRYLTIDPKKLEAALTPRTTAILATHVYGFPCAVDELAAFARAHGLKLIYDAAHTFGCELHGKPLVGYGDLSCLSFHATKIFHTIEGGAVVINNDDVLAERVKLMRSFGQWGENFRCEGINGKNSEFHAAMGLCMLPRVDALIAERREQVLLYHELLDSSEAVLPKAPEEGFKHNYAYCPIILPTAAISQAVLDDLAAVGIRARRYFFPPLNRLAYLSDTRDCPIAEDIAGRVLCLPTSTDVIPAVQHRVAGIIHDVLARSRRRIAGDHVAS